MPYNKAENSRAITAEKVTIYFDVTPAAPWTAGQSINMKATVTRDTTPFVGTKVWFFWGNSDAGVANIGSAITDANGVATFSWTIPWVFTGNAGTSTVPCKTNYAGAREDTSGATRAIGEYVAYPTRISITAPDRVVTGTTFTISGKLEYESASGVWSPLANRMVSLYYNTTKIADVTTGTDGSYSASAKINTSGTYTLKASYAGEGFSALAPTFAFLGLTVERETLAKAVAIATPIIAGAAITLLQRRRR